MNDDIVAYLEQRSFLGHENLDTLLARRKALPQEVAEAVVFLARHDFMTGQRGHVVVGQPGRPPAGNPASPVPVWNRKPARNPWWGRISSISPG